LQCIGTYFVSSGLHHCASNAQIGNIIGSGTSVTEAKSTGMGAAIDMFCIDRENNSARANLSVAARRRQTNSNRKSESRIATMQYPHRKRPQVGFTLIELLVVIAILGLRDASRREI
jgi:prepilin-type N-terminal cleavage/methylation domain-containing protein